MMKNESLPGWILGLSILAWTGCSVAPTNGAVASRSQSLGPEMRDASTPADASPGRAAAQSEDASLMPAPGAGSGGGSVPDSCNCILFPPTALSTCSAERFVCNSSLDCKCASESPSREARSAAGAPAPLPTAQPESELATDGDGSRARLATPDPPPCNCLAGTPSPPEGGCPAEDWYCNRSGRCQCDN